MSTGSYYTDWDRWFAEEHDGTPVKWEVIQVIDPEEDPGEAIEMSLIPVIGPWGRVLPPMSLRVLHQFIASSSLEAFRKNNEVLGYGPYSPFPEWDEERGVWTDEMIRPKLPPDYRWAQEGPHVLISPRGINYRFKSEVEAEEWAWCDFGKNWKVVRDYIIGLETKMYRGINLEEGR